MSENTTKTNPPRPAGSRLRILAALLLAVVFIAGCTSAREREDPQNVVGNLRFKSDDTFDYFHDVYRSGNLYQDFRPVMVVDAIYEDMRYRELFIKTLTEQFLIQEHDVARMMAEQREQYSNHMDFLLLVWGGSNDKVNLHKSKAAWKVFLRDDEDQLLTPAKMEPVNEKNPIYAFLKKYFTGLDRWSEVVRISFPKLDKHLLGQKPGAQPMRMLVTGIPGTVTMVWNDPGLFYAPQSRQ